MNRKAVSGIAVTLLLISMFTAAFNIPLTIAHVDGPTISNGHAVDQANEQQDPSFSVNRHEKFWDLYTANEWENFAKVDDDSVEMIIGINHGKPSSYKQMRQLITENQGDLVNTVSMKDNVVAVVADVPLAVASTFVENVRISGLSEYVEPNLRFQACFVPNDPYWPQQWGPAKIEADYAWNTTMGDQSVLVAIIDTGINYGHSDLAANYVPLGYDWVNNDTDPMDDHGHGTHCAGIVAATTNNGIGIAGLAQIRVMAEKCLSYKGSGYASWVANAITHAVDQGADILSLSLGGNFDSELIREAVRYAYEHDVLIVAAAGNAEADILLFPAYYKEVIAVTATDMSDDPASFTSFGEWVELAAPGVDIFSTIWDDNYDEKSGTSMACPHVSGVAALIMSQYPQMSRDQVRLQLRRTADDLGKVGFDVYYGHGRVNARRSVEESPSTHDLHVWEWRRPPYVEPDDTASFNVTVLNSGFSDENSITVQLIVNGNVVDSALINSLSSGATTTVSLSWNALAEGRYNVTAYVIPVSGENYTVDNVKSAYINVRQGKFIMVPQDCAKIQEAVELARLGEVIRVASGTYYEHVHVGRSVKLVGENCNTTIIDANQTGSGITIVGEKVHVDGFTMQNSVKAGMYTGGAILLSAKDCIIANNKLINNYEGVATILCDGNITVSNNYIDGYHDAGVGAAFVLRNNTICRNMIINPLDNYTGGIMHLGTLTTPPITSDNNIITYNTVINHLKHEFGIALGLSHNNLVIGNTLISNEIGLHMGNCKNNTVAYNNITSNYWGIELMNSPYGGSNTFHHNNMINNSEQVGILGADFYHIWDDGYPSGGNYWDTYKGVDNYSGPYQNETGSDGIGDTPYVIDENNKDHYPLMTPYPYPSIHDIAVKDVRPSRTVLGQGRTTEIHVDIANEGHFIETFNVTAYANTTVINQTEVTLTILKSTTVTFTWDTTGFAIGNYTISASVSILPNETDTADNININGIVTVRFPVHDIAVVDVSPDSNVVPRESDLNITVSVENQGDFAETFNVTAYANTIIIEEHEVVLDLEESAILIFTWNTTSFPLGNYTIRASAASVAEEMDTEDNSYIDGVVMVRLPGDVAIINVTPSKTVVGTGFNVSIRVTVENQGNYTETFDVSIYVNTTVIDTVTNIALTSGNSTTLVFIWNTASFAKGNYTITAKATRVIGETDTTDNTLIDGIVTVTTPGDVNGNLKVDIYDVVKICAAYDSEPPGPPYEPNCDINGDGKINIYDVVIACTHYGEQNP